MTDLARWDGNGSESPEWITDGRLIFKSKEVPGWLVDTLRSLPWNRERLAPADACQRALDALMVGDPAFATPNEAFSVSPNYDEVGTRIIDIGGVRVDQGYFATALMALPTSFDCYARSASIVIRRNGIVIGAARGLTTTAGYDRSGYAVRLADTINPVTP